MTLPVSLQAVIDEMDTFGDDFHPYLNQLTGELVTISTEEIQAVEQGDDLDDDSEWAPDEIQTVRDILSSADYLPLPSQFEIHEYAIMERFCLALELRRRGWKHITFHMCVMNGKFVAKPRSKCSTRKNDGLAF